MPVVLLLLVAFLLEVWTMVQVAQAIGVWETLALLIVVSAVGIWLVKREGLGVWRRLNQQLDRGNVPTAEVVDGVIILFAGLLLLTPGFVGDVVGLALLLPPIRAGVRRLLSWLTVRRLGRGAGAVTFVASRAGTAFVARGGRRVIDSTATERPTASATRPPSSRELDP